MKNKEIIFDVKAKNIKYALNKVNINEPIFFSIIGNNLILHDKKDVSKIKISNVEKNEDVMTDPFVLLKINELDKYRFKNNHTYKVVLKYDRREKCYYIDKTFLKKEITISTK
jgi:hypothetical protein